ncbi:hypothetical protein WICPIJ_007969 [Wickerhamomyces pijperi]|uniref:Spt20-like SEP domain-containing protein n=1 Tax=Wickerhamomyces pijperi TaxID=599730 RepID=A0A9P8Q0N5_WICPI|nr:hypothetical protein WICPIJ_007969 [Wickerhamomyces pijperi]
MTSVNQDLNNLKRSYADMNVGYRVNGNSITSPIQAGIAVNSGQAVNSPSSIGMPVNGTPVNKNNSITGGAVNSPNLGTIGIAVGGNTSSHSQTSAVTPSQSQQRVPASSQQSPKVLPQQQQQQQQNKANQALHMKYNLRNMKFAETSEEILKKYEAYSPSLEFHIHETYYRFGNQDGTIPKTNPMVKEFLEYVAREEIPEAIVEVLRDGGIRFFEGCLIVKIFDHRNTKNVSVTEGTETAVKDVPRTFRTVLKPTAISLFYDLLSQTDSALQRFTDTLGISMEMEILTATKRNLDLTVPLNLYKGINKSIVPESEFPKITPDGKIVHNHRVECSDPNSKAFKPFRELHDDSVPPHESSVYQDLMTVCSPHPAKEVAAESHTFSRLRFLEQFREDREKFKQESLSATRSFSNGLKFGNGAGNAASLQQQRIQQIQQQQRLNQGNASNKNSPLQHSITATGDSSQTPQASNATTSAAGKAGATTANATAEKKTKKKRGPTKKQKAAAEAAAAAAAAAAAEALQQPQQLQQISNLPQMNGMQPIQGQYGDKTLPGLTPNPGQLDLQQQQQQLMMMQQQNAGMLNKPAQVEVQQVGANNTTAKKKRGTYKKKKAETAAGTPANSSGSVNSSGK